eukprot:CAMPEP_0115354698 /NCGR_PEP_ID=MMETSP0270-20121206/98724_1 /TAXON_ID=71861 /ORGANISM="Scrippsiella trochoidea, Strain CCMP3099" /LENGTH=47 /DNA_ID= /DNA_START= /DNA_END= /DNA_ORIENTATION=
MAQDFVRADVEPEKRSSSSQAALRAATYVSSSNLLAVVLSNAFRSAP